MVYSEEERSCSSISRKSEALVVTAFTRQCRHQNDKFGNRKSKEDDQSFYDYSIPSATLNEDERAYDNNDTDEKGWSTGRRSSLSSSSSSSSSFSNIEQMGFSDKIDSNSSLEMLSATELNYSSTFREKYDDHQVDVKSLCNEEKQSEWSSSIVDTDEKRLEENLNVDREDGSKWLSPSDMMRAKLSISNPLEINKGDSSRSNRDMHSSVHDEFQRSQIEEENPLKEWSVLSSETCTQNTNVEDNFKDLDEENIFSVDKENFESFDPFSDKNSDQSIQSQDQSAKSFQKETYSMHNESPTVQEEQYSYSNSVTTRSKSTSRSHSQQRNYPQSTRYSTSSSRSSSIRNMVSEKTTTNSINYDAAEASEEKSSTAPRPASRKNSELDASKNGKSHMSGTLDSKHTSSSPSRIAISAARKASKSKRRSRTMGSSNQNHGSPRPRSIQTNRAALDCSKKTISNLKKKVEANSNSIFSPDRSNTKDKYNASRTRKSRRRKKETKRKNSLSKMNHNQSIPSISESHELSQISILSSQTESSSSHIATNTRQDIDENEEVKKSPVMLQNQRDHDTRNTFCFSQSISLLKYYNCGLKMNKKQIHVTISNEGFQNIVAKAYTKLVEVRPRLRYLFSPEEWLHIHILLIYARIFDCELHFHRIALPPEFQIKIPENIQIFEPIAAVISSIGIVDDIDMGVTYIPVARPYREGVNYKSHDKDDVTEFLEWTQYDWLGSWEQVKKGRLERKRMAAKNDIKIPQQRNVARVDDDVEKLADWEQLALEKWLGWDDELWFSYKQVYFVLSRIANFVDMPQEKSGTYAWLLPREVNNGIETIVRVPKPNISPESWMIAMMVDMCALQPKLTDTWYHTTNVIDNVPYITDQYLRAGIKSPSDMPTKCV